MDRLCGPVARGPDSIPGATRLQIQRRGFDSLRYQIFWEVVGLQRDATNVATRFM
jgi:hypothetical protein